jgi:pilus assembly protein CpaF
MDTDIISLTDLFLFNQSGVNEKGQPVGSFRSTGLRPMFDRKINNFGLSLPPELLHG